jgi:hypothetical protein
MLGESGSFSCFAFTISTNIGKYIEVIQRLYPGTERVEGNLLCIDLATSPFNQPASLHYKRERA